PSGEQLKCHVCHHNYERPDMLKCETHDSFICSLCLSTDKVADHVLPAKPPAKFAPAEPEPVEP
ncbi:MAG: hypothetical protein QOH44_265, partial [Actinomycetota bacterium]|nr:hypothetical protein [Actinomycetota bacterium]